MFRFAVSGSNFDIISYILHETRKYSNIWLFSFTATWFEFPYACMNDEMIKYVKSIYGEFMKYVNICNYLCQYI